MRWIMPGPLPNELHTQLLIWYEIWLQADLRQDPDWEETRKTCLVVSHPLFPDMLAKHAACLRVGTPVDQLPDIEAQLLRAPEVTEKYRVLRDQITDVSPEEQEDLDRFMVRILASRTSNDTGRQFASCTCQVQLLYIATSMTVAICKSSCLQFSCSL